MAPQLKQGQRAWSLTRDSEGYREYKIKHLVKADIRDGPWTVLNCPGLPFPGAPWAFDNDVDTWVWCRPDASVQLHEAREGEPHRWWIVEQTFSNKPLPINQGGQRCQDIQIQNPLLEPAKISGEFTRYTEEATQDRYGNYIMNSAFEQMRGPQLEFDKNRPTITIEQNVASAQVPLLSALVDCVNALPMWGLNPRCIKLSSASWEKKYYGQCYIYYTRRLVFEANYATWDRVLLDEGTKCLNGDWNRTTKEWELKPINGETPSLYNPTHFIRFKDFNGENCRVILNGAGIPAGVAQIKNAGAQYISLQNANVGKSLSNSNWWLPITNTAATIEEYDATSVYNRGTVVKLSGFYYRANRDQPLAPFDEAPNGWDLLTVVNPAGPVLQGGWNVVTTYLAGETVYDTQRLAPGYRYVQKYDEADFQLLGIPLTL